MKFNELKPLFDYPEQKDDEIKVVTFKNRNDKIVYKPSKDIKFVGFNDLNHGENRVQVYKVFDDSVIPYHLRNKPDVKIISQLINYPFKDKSDDTFFSDSFSNFSFIFVDNLEGINDPELQREIFNDYMNIENKPI